MVRGEMYDGRWKMEELRAKNAPKATSDDMQE